MFRNNLELINRLIKEPPLRIFARAIIRRMKPSLRTRALWEISARPNYLIGLLAAADQALHEGTKEISAIEFGVAGGNGLLSMQEEALEVEIETGIKIKVFGFDMGSKGLPSFIGDYRDHPDIWRPGDFPMDEDKLRSCLLPSTTLILGNISDTASDFFEKFNPPPIGFISVDVDLYSSCRDSLKILTSKNSKMLLHAPIYFDDIDFIFNHKYAGELLAIKEFNDLSDGIKIDRWYGISNDRPFPERPFLKKFYVAHDLRSRSKNTTQRPKATLPLSSKANN